MLREILDTEKGSALGYEIELGRNKFLLIEADLGYMVCGYFNPDTIDKAEDAAVIITGVNELEDMLEEKPSYVSKKARELGIKKNMKGIECLDRLIQSEEKDLDKEIKEGESHEIRI